MSGNNIVIQSPHITHEQCQLIIAKKYPDTQVTIVDYSLTSMDENCGFLGEHCRLKITINTDGNSENALVKCFAKFMPNTATQYDFVEGSGAFKKEAFIYEVLFPKIRQYGIDYLESCVPECYYVKPMYVLVFDDVSTHGFKPLSKYERLDYDHVMVTLKSMAKLHASSLILEEKLSKELGKPYRLLDQYVDYFYETFFLNKPKHKGGEGVFAAMKGLQTEVDLFYVENSTISNQDFKNWIEQVCMDKFELVKPSTKFRNVLCHGDLWCTNFLMQYNDGRPANCVFVDFQTVRYCPSSHDFMTFLYLTTTRAFRQQHLENLQRIYYSELQELLARHDLHLPALISYEEFRESCQEQRRFATVLTATYAQLTQVKNEFIVNFVQDDVKWNEALYVDRSIMIRENCKNDPAYRHVLQETMKDLRTLCEEDLGQN